MRKKIIILGSAIVVLVIVLIFAYGFNIASIANKPSGTAINTISTQGDSTVQGTSTGGTNNTAQTGTVNSASPQPPKANLAAYKGRVEHIFVHPLLAYPEQAFDGQFDSNGFDDWFITTGEFKKLLDSLYSKNFILVNINDVYEEYEKDGVKLQRRRELMLPEGKKPLILSLDDVNYNKYMLGNGTIYKLILDKSGDITTYSINPKGEEVISREQ